MWVPERQVDAVRFDEARISIVEPKAGPLLRVAKADALAVDANVEASAAVALTVLVGLVLGAKVSGDGEKGGAEYGGRHANEAWSHEGSG